jgi:FkbM family methyltransferase
MTRGKLVVHHVGARGPTQAFPANPAFDASIVNVLYEADPDCIEELEALNRGRAARVIVLNECVSGTGGTRTFCDAHHGYGSSLLEANAELRSLYIAAHWIDYDYTVHDAVSAKSRRQVATRTLDQVAADRDDVPLPDFISLDTQGTELEILRGAPVALGSSVAVVTEVEFVPLYEGQPLFGEICDFLTGHGFVFARFFRVLDGSLHRAPVGLRGNGIPVTTDALFLRHPASIVASEGADRDKALRLAKLAFFALSQGYLEHALWALEEAKRYGWDTLGIDEAWYRFMLDFHAASKRFPALMPETFAERHRGSSPGKEAFAARVGQQVAPLTEALAHMRDLLRRHHFDEAADAMLRQMEVDQKRLGLPAALSQVR